MISRILSKSTSLLNQSKFCFAVKPDVNKRHFVLEYKFVDEMHYKRVPHREKHQTLIEKYEDKDNLIFGGSLFPNDGAFLLFNCADERTPHDFVKEDPYYKNGLITDYSIKEIEIHTRTQFKELAKVYAYR